MENKKYYTPTIEEFHVGFEYEYIKSSYWGALEKTKDWTKEIFSGCSTMDEGSEHDWIDSAITNENNEQKVRVKYLDQHDIESLGWGYSGDAKANDNSLEIIYFSIDDYSLSFYLINDMYGDNINISISQTVNGDYDDLFQGNIRNKSELNQVMRMVGIPS